MIARPHFRGRKLCV